MNFCLSIRTKDATGKTLRESIPPFVQYDRQEPTLSTKEVRATPYKRSAFAFENGVARTEYTFMKQLIAPL